MEVVVFDPLPFAAGPEALSARLRLRPGSGAQREALALLNEGLARARPRGTYGAASVTGRDNGQVALEGVTFRGGVLAKKLSRLDCAYPCLCTAGAELAAWAASQTDPLHQFYADAICEAVLLSALESLVAAVKERHGHTALARLSPGSLPDWPLEEQMPLFALLGDGPAAIGVTLTDSMLMVPVKSVSGILFAGHERFTSCRLCPRERCPNRKAPHDPAADA